MQVSIAAKRIERLLDAIVHASQGNFDVRVALEEIDDAFLEIEVGINYMLEELAARRDEGARHHQEQLENSRRLADQQSELVQALSTPLIEVWPGVLTLPLIGRVGDERAADITRTLLARVAETRATHVIVDLTGVGALDPGAVPALLRMMRAIELLGARCLWTGLGPAVVQQVVGLAGVTRLRAFGRLADALAVVLEESGALRR